MDSKTIRLRASCNACNESKVRCSQHKPACARCERNGSECIYGLSRRTHKDAPPISMPSSQRASRSSSSTDTTASGRWSVLSLARSSTAVTSSAESESCEQPITKPHRNEILFADGASWNFAMLSQQQTNMAPAISRTTTTATTDSSLCHELLTDFGNIVDTMSEPSSHFQDPGVGSASSWSALGPEFAGSGHQANSSSSSSSNDVIMFDNTHHNITPGSLTSASSAFSRERGECTCHSRVMELLVSVRHGRSEEHRRVSLDAHLANLKQCIVSCETSIGCSHGQVDAEPIHLMTVAALIGYVIDEFEMLASEESPLRKPPQGDEEAALVVDMEPRGPLPSPSAGARGQFITNNMSLRSLREPRVSWGVLELEDDDEADLRRRLFLLSFRKLEKLLWQLTTCLRNLHDAQANRPRASRQMAFAMACDYTLLWLERKAEYVKAQFSMVAGDEKVDQALS